MKRTLLTFAVLFGLTGCGWIGPPLIEGADQIGHIGYSCFGTRDPTTDPRIAQSPIVNDRLRQSFPPGTPAKRLVEALQEQGFVAQGKCSNHANISWSRYGKAGDFIGADVYWREDYAGRLIWSFGHVSYTFL